MRFDATLLALAAVGLSGCTQVAWVAMVGPGAVGEAVTRSRRPVRFTVVDADTNRPVPGAEVVVEYANDWYGPDATPFTTDAAGRAKQWIVTNRFPSFGVKVNGTHWSTLNPTPNALPAAWTILALRPPRPYHVLEVPVGYRGPVVVGLPPQPDEVEPTAPGDPTWPAGQRAWVTRVADASPTTLPTLPLSGRYEPTRLLRAQTTDGVALPLVWDVTIDPGDLVDRAFTRVPSGARLAHDAVGVWTILHEGRLPSDAKPARVHFFVGTRLEAVRAQDRLKAEEGATSGSTRERARVEWVRRYPAVR